MINNLLDESYGLYQDTPAPGFTIKATTDVRPVAAAECEEKDLYLVQFHPEVVHTVEGTKILSNFLFNICNCKGEWKMDSFVETNDPGNP